jgi:hypothetical protein
MIELAVFATGCESSEPNETNKYPAELKPYYDALSDKKDLEINVNTADFLCKTKAGYDTLKLCAGIKNNKVWLGVFRPIVPLEKYEEFFTWVSSHDIEKEQEYNLGYGEKEVKAFDWIFALGGIAYSENDIRAIFSLHYGSHTINQLYNTNASEFVTLSQNDGYATVHYWNDNLFILDSRTYFSGESSAYDYNGTFLHNADDFPLRGDYNYSVINDKEAIFYNDTSTPLRIFRQDIEYVPNTNEVWERYLVLDESIPANARIGKLVLVRKDGITWFFKINVTLYSGEKTTYDFSVNIDTGDITYLT